MKTIENKSERDPILTRVIEFMDSKGGINEVSNVIKWNYQTLNSMIKRSSTPKSDLLRDIALKYPDFDLNYIITGESKGESNKIAELESDLALFKALLKSNIQGKDEDILQTPLVDREGYSELLTSITNKDTSKYFVRILAIVGKKLALKNMN